MAANELCKVGAVVFTRNHGNAVVIEYLNKQNIKIRFDNTGHEQFTTSGQIKSGLIRDRSVNCSSIKVGDVLQSNHCGKCTVLEYNGARNILVRFESGIEKVFSSSQLNDGNMSDKIWKVVQVGDVFSTNSSGDVEVLEILPKSKFLVKFSDGNTKICSRSALEAGAVLNGTWHYSHEEAVEALKSLGTRYTFDKTEFRTVKGHILVTCPDHGDFKTSMDSLNRGSGCKFCGIEKRARAKTIPLDIVMKDVLAVHGDRYDYSKVNYKNNNTKVEIVCTEHGSFWQSFEKHKSGQQCPTCAGNSRMTLERFLSLIPQQSRYLYSYELIKEEHFLTEKKKLPIVCTEHGVFYQTYNSHIKGCGCRKCAKYGFSTSKPGTLYVLKDGGRVKVGITNRDIAIRLNEINREGCNFEVSALYAYSDGTVCLSHETETLKYLRSLYENTAGNFSGVTESFENVDISSVISFIDEMRNYGKEEKQISYVWPVK